MYKVFFNARKIILANDIEASGHSKKCPSFEYNKISQLEKIVLEFLENNNYECIVLSHQNLEKLFFDFSGLFNFITAAGGLVKNDEGKYLLIFRRGKWDLPKGKAEINESPENTAIREVEEETGLKKISIVRQLPETYHCYSQKNKHILKLTNWFEMNYNGTDKPIPQTSEDITEAVWLKEDAFEQIFANTFPSITEVFSSAGLMKKD